ncbi:hypothetical protein DFP72DRAFT_1169139 [Ephemerocybe angulata]|uniref:Uncharacterized protein n=1 Tax=Ephemerocybe angulata TaxID=980116 RepID=A0A8H6I2D8_9AGAR|nr:hypothetical protein DFP72DRAFT_1169139 [Tulosesus angulatus]
MVGRTLLRRIGSLFHSHKQPASNSKGESSDVRTPRPARKTLVKRSTPMDKAKPRRIDVVVHHDAAEERGDGEIGLKTMSSDHDSLRSMTTTMLTPTTAPTTPRKTPSSGKRVSWAERRVETSEAEDLGDDDGSPIARYTRERARKLTPWPLIIPRTDTEELTGTAHKAKPLPPIPPPSSAGSRTPSLRNKPAMSPLVTRRSIGHDDPVVARLGLCKRCKAIVDETEMADSENDAFFSTLLPEAKGERQSTSFIPPLIFSGDNLDVPELQGQPTGSSGTPSTPSETHDHNGTLPEQPQVTARPSSDTHVANEGSSRSSQLQLPPAYEDFMEAKAAVELADCAGSPQQSRKGSDLSYVSLDLTCQPLEESKVRSAQADDTRPPSSLAPESSPPPFQQPTNCSCRDCHPACLECGFVNQAIHVRPESGEEYNYRISRDITFGPLTTSPEIDARLYMRTDTSPGLRPINRRFRPFGTAPDSDVETSQTGTMLHEHRDSIERLLRGVGMHLDQDDRAATGEYATSYSGDAPAWFGSRNGHDATYARWCSPRRADSRDSYVSDYYRDEDTESCVSHSASLYHEDSSDTGSEDSHVSDVWLRPKFTDQACSPPPAKDFGSKGSMEAVLDHDNSSDRSFDSSGDPDYSVDEDASFSRSVPERQYSTEVVTSQPPWFGGGPVIIQDIAGSIKVETTRAIRRIVPPPGALEIRGHFMVFLFKSPSATRSFEYLPGVSCTIAGSDPASVIITACTTKEEILATWGWDLDEAGLDVDEWEQSTMDDILCALAKASLHDYPEFPSEPNVHGPDYRKVLELAAKGGVTMWDLFKGYVSPPDICEVDDEDAVTTALEEDPSDSAIAGMEC